LLICIIYLKYSELLGISKTPELINEAPELINEPKKYSSFPFLKGFLIILALFTPSPLNNILALLFGETETVENINMSGRDSAKTKYDDDDSNGHPEPKLTIDTSVSRPNPLISGSKIGENYANLVNSYNKVETPATYNAIIHGYKLGYLPSASSAITLKI
jgi:hypothetical protein